MATKAIQVDFLLSQVRNAIGSLIGGTVYFYEAGASESPGNLRSIWLDRDKATPAGNPYTLDANGTAQLYADGIYKVVIKNSAGSTVYTRDDLDFSKFDPWLESSDYASVADAEADIPTDGGILHVDDTTPFGLWYSKATETSNFESGDHGIASGTAGLVGAILSPAFTVMDSTAGTSGTYTTGTATTNGTTSVTGSGTTWVDSGIAQHMVFVMDADIADYSKQRRVASVSGNGTITLSKSYNGSLSGAYTIYKSANYNKAVAGVTSIVRQRDNGGTPLAFNASVRTEGTARGESGLFIGQLVDNTGSNAYGGHFRVIKNVNEGDAFGHFIEVITNFTGTGSINSEYNSMAVRADHNALISGGPVVNEGFSLNSMLAGTGDIADGGGFTVGLNLSNARVTSDAIRMYDGQRINFTQGALAGTSTIAASTTKSGINITTNQTAVHTTDVGDSGATTSYSMTAASASNQLISAAHKVNVTNALTGGGQVTNMRGLGVATNTSTGTNTGTLSAIYVETGTQLGTVGTGHGIFISSVQGTVKYSIYDASGATAFFSGKVAAKIYTGTVAALTPSGTVSLDASTGSMFTLTPAQDETINITNLTAGQTLDIVILTSGTTSRTITFGTGFRTTGTLATGVSDAKYFVVSFVCPTASVCVERSRTTAM